MPFGTCQNCHCNQGVTVTSVTVSGEVGISNCISIRKKVNKLPLVRNTIDQSIDRLSFFHFLISYRLNFFLHSLSDRSIFQGWYSFFPAISTQQKTAVRENQGWENPTKSVFAQLFSHHLARWLRSLGINEGQPPFPSTGWHIRLIWTPCWCESCILRILKCNVQININGRF